jgi:hypothetical protein
MDLSGRHRSSSPAGTFSQHSDGEKEAVRSLGARSATLVIGETVEAGAFLSFTIREERPDRAMRGCADA